MPIFWLLHWLVSPLTWNNNQEFRGRFRILGLEGIKKQFLRSKKVNFRRICVCFFGKIYRTRNVSWLDWPRIRKKSTYQKGDIEQSLPLRKDDHDDILSTSKNANWHVIRRVKEHLDKFFFFFFFGTSANFLSFICFLFIEIYVPCVA